MQQKFNPRLYLNELQETTAIASLHYEIWWVYTGVETHDLYAKVRNRYSHFFFASEKAHVTALIISLYRLYETRRNTFNVPSFLKLMEETKKFKADSLVNFRKQQKNKTPMD